MNLSLALDVSWRRHTGPRSTVTLSAYGAGARSTAKRLGMTVEGDRAHITERTPELAEAALMKQPTKVTP